MADRLLIIGLGSAGSRHARNALALGCEVIGYDSRKATPELLANLRPGISLVDSLNDGFEQKPLGVIIATPPETHFSIATQIASLGDFPCLIEKPLAISAEQGRIIIEAFELRAPLAVGYQLRHTTALRALKAKADVGEFGKIHASHVEFGSKKWCSNTYPADPLLECSHELDLLRWILGDFTRARASQMGGRWRITLVDIPRTAGTFSLDTMWDGYSRHLWLVAGTDGGRVAAEWEFSPAENDAAYVAELRDFLAVCRGEKAQPVCTSEDGWWALRMVEAIKKSAESGRWEMV